MFNTLLKFFTNFHTYNKKILFLQIKLGNARLLSEGWQWPAACPAASLCRRQTPPPPHRQGNRHQLSGIFCRRSILVARENMTVWILNLEPLGCFSERALGQNKKKKKNFLYIYYTFIHFQTQFISKQ